MTTDLPLEATHDPITQFEAWLQAAERTEPNDPNAMSLSTCTADGRLSSRMVLLKGVDARGFVFYTNCESQKGWLFRKIRVPPWDFIGKACGHKFVSKGR